MVVEESSAASYGNSRVRGAAATGCHIGIEEVDYLRKREQAMGKRIQHADRTAGMTPTTFRAGGARAEIRFAVGASALGAVLVAMSDRGVCAILLGEDAVELVRELEGRFPRAVLVGGDAAFEAYVAEVVGFVERPEVGLGLPLDIRGTVFQQRVWAALREVPVGATASYAEVAGRLGLAGGARAVAGACAANALAVAIPCHRVVRSDGGLSGYRWGVERKRALLRREGQAAKAGAEDQAG